MNQLDGRKTVLAVTGGIAAFKAMRVLRLLKQRGADVHVVMTAHATEFLTPLGFAMVSGHPVGADGFVPAHGWQMAHLALARGTELALVAPATANAIAKLATGIADDLFSTLFVALAHRVPTFLAPAMNPLMFGNDVVQAHLDTLRGRGVQVIAPRCGQLASKAEGEGVGRLAEPEDIMSQVCAYLRRASAGGKQERS